MKLILCGACGRMGRTVARLASENRAEIVCGVDIRPSPMPFPVYPAFSDVSEQADVLIDFSSANGLEERLSFCAAHKLPAVLAATGYTEDDKELIDRYAKQIALFQTGNLSVGVNVLQFLVRKAAEALGGYDVEIIEKHHRTKKDAPSGTALMLAESAEQGRGARQKRVFGRQGLTDGRSDTEIGIHAVRGGTIVGEHEVIFAGEDEILTLSHSARSRSVFASGALRAAEFLIGKPAARYDMNDLLESVFR